MADWVYGVACGINTVESAPGFEEIEIIPHPTDKIDHLGALIETKYGKVSSAWRHQEGKIRYEIEIPTKAKVVIEGKEYHLTKGKYTF